MKNIFRILMAVAVLFTASCAKEDISSSIAGGEANVTFTVDLPELGTRAYGEGNHATTLKFFVYEYENENVIGKYLPNVLMYNADNEGTNVIESTSKRFNFSLTLIKGMKYNIVFWADKGEFSPYAPEYVNGVPTGVIKANYSDVYANDDTLDAFFGSLKNFDPAAADAQSKAGKVELKRPFAQLNAKTTDLTEIQRSGATLTKSALSVKTYTTLDLFSGNVGGLDEDNAVVFKSNLLPDSNGHISMNYLLAPTTKCTADVTLSYTFEGANVNFPAATYSYVPLQRNYKTNIIGKLLTASTDFIVEIKPGFEEPDQAPEALFLAAVNGGEVTLTEDVVLTQPLKVQSTMTLNLNGKTITTTEKETGRHHYAIDNYGSLTIIGDGAINARGIQNFGEMVIDGDLTITNVDTNGGAAIWNEGKLTINNGNFATNATAGEGSYGAALNTRPNGEAVVNGGNFNAYSQLTYAIINEGTTTINNAVVKGKHGAVCGAGSTATNIYGGSFELLENPNVSDHCAYKVSAIYGGTFSLGNNTDSGAQVFYQSNIAAGYKAVVVDGKSYVLPEVVADAAEDANVTAVTESTADVATALATNNGEATMFMWNDVAYIAKYGEVVITSSADEATTVRAVVEYAAGLTKATVKEGVEVVGNRTFRKCANLETVTLPNSLTEIGPAVFQSCSKLKNVTIPASVTTIGEGAFAECVALTSINIPNGITRLEKDVLRNTGLVSIEIPASVNYIGTYAFRDCESLTEVKILSPEFTIENNSFTNTAAPVPTMTIYVVNNEMKAYLDSTLTNYDKSYITVVVM